MKKIEILAKKISNIPIILLGIFFITSPTYSQIRQFEFLVNQTGIKNQEVSDAAQYYAPKGSRFEILDQGNSQFVIRFNSLGDSSAVTKDFNLYFGDIALVGSVAPTKVLVDVNYIIAQASMPNYNYKLLFGPDFGALTVPFKLQIKDGALSTGASLGLYFGWKQRWIGLPSTVLLTGGLSFIPLQNLNTSTVDTKAGLTFALGLVVEPVRQFQLGIIVGLDHLGGTDGEQYPYEDKCWISFGVGYGFIK